MTKNFLDDDSKRTKFLKDNFSNTIFDNANICDLISPPYLYKLYRCDTITFEKSIFVSPPSYINSKLIRWITAYQTTSSDGVIVRKPQLK